MRRTLLILITSIICFLLLSECKKYPKDEHFTFKTVNKRLTGTYILDKYMVNNIDSTSLLPPCNNINSVPYANNDNAYYYQFDGHSHIKGCDGSGRYSFGGNRKSTISIGYSLTSPHLSPLEPIKGSNGTWVIQKLTNSEAWFTQSYNNLSFEIHLKKIHRL